MATINACNNASRLVISWSMMQLQRLKDERRVLSCQPAFVLWRHRPRTDWWRAHCKFN